MKVVILSNRDVRGGGGYMAAFRLLHALLKQGVDAQMLVKEKDSRSENVISMTNSIWQKSEAFFKEYGERLFLFTRVKEQKDRFNFSMGKRGMPILKHPLIQDADIIHLHWINKSFVSLSTIRQLAEMGKKLVWTFHDMWAFTGGCHYSGSCIGFQKACGHCPLLRAEGPSDLSRQGWQYKSDQFELVEIHAVTCSSWLEDLAFRSSIWRDRPVRTINNPIDTSFFSPRDEMATELADSESDPIRLLFLARDIHDRRKGLDLLIKAIEMVVKRRPELRARIELILAGENKGKEVSTSVKATYTGFVSGLDQLKDIYLSSDVFLLPSREDNLPNTLVEASACALPSIAFGVGGIPEMIRQGETGYLIEPENVVLLSEAIETVATLSKKEMKTLKMGARALALRKYSPQAVADQYIDVYTSIL